MTNGWRRGLVLALLLTAAPPARAADEADVVRKAVGLLEEVSSDPGSGIPPRFLREARGILIVPGMVETQLVVGRKKGHGVFLSRDEKGGWGRPEPVEISALSVGALAGREVTDMVLVYRTRKAADKHDNLVMSLGFSFQAHRFLKHANALHGPGPESKTARDVLTYTRRRGALVGAAITAERQWAPSPVPEGLESPPRAVRTAAGAAPPASAPGDPPDVRRLKALLTALTAPPPARVAGTGARATKDPGVIPTGGATPSPAR